MNADWTDNRGYCSNKNLIRVNLFNPRSSASNSSSLKKPHPHPIRQPFANVEILSRSVGQLEGVIFLAEGTCEAIGEPFDQRKDDRMEPFAQVGPGKDVVDSGRLFGFISSPLIASF